MVGLVPSYEETPNRERTGLLSATWDTVRRWLCSGQEGRPHQEPARSAPGSGASSLQNCSNKCVPCKPPPRGLLLWQPDQMNPHRSQHFCEDETCRAGSIWWRGDWPDGNPWSSSCDGEDTPESGCPGRADPPAPLQPHPTPIRQTGLWALLKCA